MSAEGRSKMGRLADMFHRVWVSQRDDTHNIGRIKESVPQSKSQREKDGK